MELSRKLSPPVTLFYSYAPEDEDLQQQLEHHLSLLRRQGLITDWHPRKISPGDDWIHAVNQKLQTASIILLLVSPAFIASDYCYGNEMYQALTRHMASEALVIPILLRPVDWETAPFAHLQCLPRNRRFIDNTPNRDDVLAETVKELRLLIQVACGIASPQSPSSV